MKVLWKGRLLKQALTFAFTLQYDQFRELFNKNKKAKKKNK
jgi:hypothetical protein